MRGTVKLYQIANNATDDSYVGTTTSALYKRLYRHKHDADIGLQSKLCNLMRAVGKDKFKIEMLEEGVFSCTDAVNAREAFWIRETRSSLNETSQEKRVERKQRQEASVHTDHDSTPTGASTTTSPPSFDLSDEEVEAETPPEDLPTYDLTDVRFNALRGKIEDEDNKDMKFYYTRLLKLGKHLQSNPRDAEASENSSVFKRLLAYKVALVRLDAGKSGLDLARLTLLDTIEQEAGINEKFHSEAAPTRKNSTTACAKNKRNKTREGKKRRDRKAQSWRNKHCYEREDVSLTSSRFAE